MREWLRKWLGIDAVDEAQRRNYSSALDGDVNLCAEIEVLRKRLSDPPINSDQLGEIAKTLAHVEGLVDVKRHMRRTIEDSVKRLDSLTARVEAMEQGHPVAPLPAIKKRAAKK